MSVTHSLDEALSRSEAELRGIAADALGSGDYASARQGMELAESLAGLRAHAGLGEASHKRAVLPPKAPTSPPSKPAGKEAKSKPVPAKPRPTSGGYPRFVREGDKLVKIGWSKRTRKEYTHKAPRSAVEAFAIHLRQNSQPDRIFRVDDILPVSDPENTGELPSYQVYLALAWFRDLGLIHKHGRDGYAAGDKQLTAKILASHWDSLDIETSIAL